SSRSPPTTSDNPCVGRLPAATGTFVHIIPHLDRAAVRRIKKALYGGREPCRHFRRVHVSRANFLFTSESVSEGHPDKVSDQISDAILDAFLEKDVKLGIADDSQVNTRLGCETLCTTNKIVVAGEGRGQLFKTINGISVVDREEITEIARGV